MVKAFISLLLSVSLCFCSKNNSATVNEPQVSLLSGAQVRVSPNPVAGSAYDGNMYLSYSGGNGGSYEAGQALSSTGVTGLAAVLTEGVLKEGIGHLVYKLSGTPASAGTARFAITFGGQTTNVDIEVTAAPANNKLYWGFFDDSGTPMSFYNGFGKNPSMAMMFNGWEATGSKNFPVQFCQNAFAGGYVPHVTLEPKMGMVELMSGKYDEDIKKYGEAIAALGKPIVLRFAHEFNGDWYPWSILNDQLVPAATYVQAFRYMRDKIRVAGGTNAYWVWAPNNENGAKNPQTLDAYYPGDAYVDIIGMDGYNFGTSQSWSNWQGFGQVFGGLYDWIVQAHPDKPVFICEMGTSSTGGDKAAWITDMFAQLETRFPKVKGFVWFNINKETDWRFTETQQSIDAFKAALSNPRVVTDATFGGIIK
ncbi:MAG: hypothetical protein DI535_00085 [Citrobacter freundii]|nr:MAG: hypothetical protein DI535_00085 [Citrobacter freundii]